MREWFRRLLQPMATRPTGSFRWSDKRPVPAQLVSGVQRAAGLIAGFAVLVGLFGGMAVLSDTQERGTGQVVFSCGILVLASGIMFITAHRWSPFVTGFFFGPAILRIASVLIFGTDSYYSTNAFSRIQAVELLSFAVIVVGLTVRFVGTRPAPTMLIDRLALTFFALAVTRQIFVPYRFPPWPLLSGLATLLIAWLASRRRPHTKRQGGGMFPGRRLNRSTEIPVSDNH